MATVNLGKVGLTPKGEYDPEITYQRLDFVTYQEASYVALTATTGHLPTDSQYWQLLAASNPNAIWKANTKTDEGYVEKGEDNVESLWGTDEEGNPKWIPKADVSTKLPANSKDEGGIVTKGSEGVDSLWATDSEGNPAWAAKGDVLPLNSKTADGFVAKGGNNYNMVWGTDDEGNPQWIKNESNSTPVATIDMSKFLELVLATDPNAEYPFVSIKLEKPETPSADVACASLTFDVVTDIKTTESHTLVNPMTVQLFWGEDNIITGSINYLGSGDEPYRHSIHLLLPKSEITTEMTTNNAVMLSIPKQETAIVYICNAIKTGKMDVAWQPWQITAPYYYCPTGRPYPMFSAARYNLIEPTPSYYPQPEITKETSGVIPAPNENVNAVFSTDSDGNPQWQPPSALNLPTNTEVDTKIAEAITAANVPEFIERETVPSVEEAEKNKFYLVKNAETEHYDIYALLGDKVERIDDTTVDLSNYVTKEEGKGLSSEDFTAALKAKLDGIEDNAQVNKIESISVNGTKVEPNEQKNVDIEVYNPSNTTPSAPAATGSVGTESEFARGDHQHPYLNYLPIEDATVLDNDPLIFPTHALSLRFMNGKTPNCPTPNNGGMLLTMRLWSTTGNNVQLFIPDDASQIKLGAMWIRAIKADGMYTDWEQIAKVSDIAKNALPLSGGTITGDLTLSGATRCIGYNSGTRSGTPIVFGAGDKNGSGITIGDGGRIIIGAGESADNLREEFTDNATEIMHIGSDNEVFIHTSCNTMTTKHVFTFQKDGRLSGVEAPTVDTDAANKAYVDSLSIFDLCPDGVMHRNLFRGKNLGGSVTAEQLAAIKDGSFKDLFIGDYWTIDGVNWLIADMDYFYQAGDTAFMKHHLVIIPQGNLYNAQMNSTNTTEGGYVGSEMYKTGLNNAKEQIKAAFPDMVLSHRDILINQVTDGHPSESIWTDSEIELMTEVMVYGTYHYAVMNPGSYLPTKYTTARQQFAIFALNPYYAFIGRIWNWLRDVASTASFAGCAHVGAAGSTVASGSHGVRPYFCIGSNDPDADMPVEGPEMMDEYMQSDEVLSPEFEKPIDHSPETEDEPLTE